MVRPRLLDLFCGAGGAAVGYHRADFEVVGVDIRPQPYYPFGFEESEALGVLEDLLRGVPYLFGLRHLSLDDFDAIHASPPCQRYSEGGRRYPEKQASHPDLIAPTRELILETGLPYVIENVVGALKELRNPVTICGRSAGLPRIARHRLFETNWPLFVARCTCATAPPKSTIGVYGDRPDGRNLNSRYPGARAARGLAEAQEAMGMDWADWHGTKEAIPPAYTELIGHQLMQHVRARATA